MNDYVFKVGDHVYCEGLLQAQEITHIRDEFCNLRELIDRTQYHAAPLKFLTKVPAIDDSHLDDFIDEKLVECGIVADKNGQEKSLKETDIGQKAFEAMKRFF